MIRIACLAVAVLSLGACGGSKSNAALGKYAEECTATMACASASGLECINGVCTLKCGTVTECAKFSAKALCSFGVCYDACQDKGQCPNGLDCVMVGSTQGTCRPLLAQ
jgi:hypothetical protein